METVKVDMQKLQLLNERIAQTIEALNQVRMSVHGLQHSSQIGGWAPTAFGYGAYAPQTPYGIYNPLAFSPQVYGQQPFAPQFVPQFAHGFQHTTPLQSYGTPLQSYGTPLQSYGTPLQSFGYPTTVPTWTTPQFPASFSNGLSHTTWEPKPWFQPTLY